jgi:FkbM family methyltransferase
MPPMRAAPGSEFHEPQGFGAQGRLGRALMPLIRRLPPRVRKTRLIDSLLLGPSVFAPRSWLRFLELEKFPDRLPPGADTVALDIRPFDGQVIQVRPGGSDWEVVHSALFEGYHRPPSDLAPVRTILDLGSNIGVTVADLASLYPQARILGIELDADNVELARQNTSRFSDRVEVLHGAAWTEDGKISYGGDRGEWGYQVAPAMTADAPQSIIGEVPAYSLSTLIDRLAPNGSVDYLKMDVEGAEIQLLGDGAKWAERVRCINVEIHVPFDVRACARELTRLGFSAAPDPSGTTCVLGYR